MSEFGDEYFDEENEFQDEKDGESADYDDFFAESEIPPELMNEWKQAELALETQKLNQLLLQQAETFLSKSWFWKFRSLKVKLKMLSDTYQLLFDLARYTE